jgi:hypothetical protein
VHAVAGEHTVQEAGEAANVPTGHVEAVYAQVVAPAALYAPAGQGEGSAEESGQKEPAGHRTGVPEAQNEPAGQGTQVSERTQLLLASPM